MPNMKGSEGEEEKEDKSTEHFQTGAPRARVFGGKGQGVELRPPKGNQQTGLDRLEPRGGGLAASHSGRLLSDTYGHTSQTGSNGGVFAMV